MDKMTCKTCSNEFVGKYCNECGEQIISDKDFTISGVLGQAFEAITNFDSKLFVTLKLLFFYPGKLTDKFVGGIRRPYMRPFQIFVISNIIFFFFLSEIDLFRTPSKWFFVENFDGIKVLQKVREIAENTGLSETEIAYKYDTKSSNLAKGMIVFLIPFIAFVGKLLNYRRKIEFGKHIVFSTHFFSFVLLLSVIISQSLKLSMGHLNKWLFIGPVTFLMALYYIVGIKYIYRNTWLSAFLKGLVGVFLINMLIQLYRVFINVLSLNMI